MIGTYPLLGRRARTVTFVLGTAPALLMSLAVIGVDFHTPLDEVGSLLLSVGVVTAGAPRSSKTLYSDIPETAGLRSR